MTIKPVNATHRPVSRGLEKILLDSFKVLDYGFIRVTDYMGDDRSIVNAARLSYQKGTKQVSQDEGLINYLIRNWHNTPVEQCEIQLHIKLPIFVMRQWIRHRTASVNEMSARYSILDNEFYIPDANVLGEQSTANNQGRDGEVPPEYAEKVRALLFNDATTNYAHYEELLNDPKDEQNFDPALPSLARELARMNLPVNIYTQMVWKIDLHNLFNFLRLRVDSHAQWEIRQYADIINDHIVKKWVPLAHRAFEKYRLNAVTFTENDIEALQNLIGPSLQFFATDAPADWNKREWAELRAKVEKVFG